LCKHEYAPASITRAFDLIACKKDGSERIGIAGRPIMTKTILVEAVSRRSAVQKMLVA
jgi:hypothetical protein